MKATRSRHGWVHIVYVIVRPLSTVEYTVDSGLTNLIHDREQARREWESELRHVNSLQTLL